jgi:hypothetical protein
MMARNNKYGLRDALGRLTIASIAIMRGCDCGDVLIGPRCTDVSAIKALHKLVTLASASARGSGTAGGKGWVDRDPPVVKLKVLSARRKVELLRLLRSRRSSEAPIWSSSRRAQHLL